MSLHDHDDELQFQPERDRNRPSSIDLSLELERQLEAESLPNSPEYNQTNFRQSLDPHVLASIVSQLRLSVAELTKERDELSIQLSKARTNEEGLKETVNHVTEKCLRLETDLTAAQDQHKDDEDAITMLRSKLEDSRRALMRLQTESRRMSHGAHLSIDLSKAGQSSFTGPPSSRRASFVPLTGSPAGKTNVHRRISSVSTDGGAISAPVFSEPSQWASPPRFQLSEIPHTALPAPSRRTSGFWGRTSPQPSDLPPPTDAPEVEELRKELQAVKEQLEETRHELSEAHEAREASETCVNALRTFIADNSIGMAPPTTARGIMSPAMSTVDHNRSSSSASTRWGFRLWKTETAPSAATTPILTSPVPPSQSSNSPATSTPRSRFGSLSLFSSRASVSSTQTDSALPQPESMSSVSDTSSLEDPVAEPISPTSLGPKDNVIVRVASDSQSDDLLLPTPQAKDTAGMGFAQQMVHAA